MIDGFFRVAHVLGEPAVHVILETVHVMFFAHPVFPAFAETAFPTRDDLFGNQAIADLDFTFASYIFAKLDDVPDELVTGNHWGLDIRRLTVSTPERFSSDVGFDVACTNPAGLDFYDDVIGSGPGDWNRLEPVITGCIGDDGPHRFWQFVSRQLSA